ncbi:MAG: M67 family metallopeptidase [Meiothermus sp.]|uniref:M67 family metallopeptidase n=1 Tax=Meiothermus sp. TaxID=1955249 RepID=UPI0025E8A419|nr:M67 family metallopeptidase [Meiothermus sp.]MCS7057527.1 M67 family metallopeptidase [Meiothermus sp.]MCS7193716.1 M67 family metallopeptidase [Meiothermus sp.]MCX7740560.1 M67 family metallopeptidase [Meiothermus sp.]MDW8089929.1 M67 family metallopeptidase [Meiothermus sp.]MDW8481646.1 M67 family metallopeptidase [Meiothermus sp.]
MKVLRLSKDCLEQTLAHLRGAYPEEGVGLWLGRAGRVERVLPLKNIHPTPWLRYRAEPQAVLRALQGAEAEGMELLAIYHSHPQGPAEPSSTDVAEAYWRVPYVIFDLKRGIYRAYRLPEGEEVGLELL